MVTPEVKLAEVRRKSFRDQAMWFLDSSDAGEDPEKCEAVHKLVVQKLEHPSIASPEKGESVFDELTAHRLLEFLNKPCTR